MTKASDNVFPKLIFAEGAAPSTPSSGQVKLYAKADGLLYSKDDAGVETLVSGGAGGGSLSDGDKGDVTVSSSGTVWTIDPNTVSYAKMQDVSATDKLLGRSTAGSGDVEEIACTAAGRALLDDADAAAQRTTLGLGSMATQAASAVAITGGTITGLGTPSSSSDAATKAYVDSLIAGLKWKQTVVAATTGAGTLATSFENGDTLDGVTLATNDRILVKDQAAPAENGIYVVAASGAPTRATDADAGSELVSACVVVEQGTVNADKAFVCTNNSITLGSTSIVFANFASTLTGALLATNNLSDLGSASTARGNLGLGTLATQSGTFSGTSSGTNTGDQTITLTGDVTGTGAGSFAATIASAAVTLAKMADLAQDQFIGRTTASTGVPQTATITAAARTVLDDTTVAAMVDTLGGASSTGTGGLVRATSPTLVTPALGTPASGTLTNCTGLPIAGGGTGASTAAAAFSALAPTTTKGDLIVDDGTDPQRLAVGTNGKVPIADSSASVGVAWGYRSMCIAMWARGDSTLTLTNCPSADTLVPGAGVTRMVVKADLSSYRQARLVGVREGGTVATGMTMHLRYHTAFSATVGDYVAIGTSAVSVACDPASPPKYMDSGWVDLAAGARADDLFLALVTNGGDGAADPTFGNIYVYFR